MKFSPIALIASATAVAAQSLLEALASQNNSLSALNTLLSSQPGLVAQLGTAQNITILAPNNDALSLLLNDTQRAAQLTQDPSRIAALLSYHVLNGTFYASQVTNTSAFIPTFLRNETYSNVTGGQRVQAVLLNNTVTLFSALKENSTVVTPNVNFTGGTIHIINRVLNIPGNISTTLQSANLTAAAGAVKAANVESALAEAKDLTIFAPSNAAFNRIGNITANLTTEQLGDILKYHVVAGQVAYSSQLGNTSVQTLGGKNVTITNINGTLFVNSARVVVQDVLVSNGVVHVIDNVLNPSNTTASPNANGNGDSGQAFAGAGTATGGVPYTSGIPAPTSTAPVATGNPGGVQSTQSSSQLAPMRTAAVGAAALFGGAAMFMNM